MKKSKKILIAVIAILLVLVVGVDLYGGNFLVDYSIARSGDGGNRSGALEVDEEALAASADTKEANKQAQRALTAAFVSKHEEEIVSITATDGTYLSAGCYRQADSHKWAILIHGYRGNHYGMTGFAQRYYDAGYNVLAPDLRGCGQSGSDYVGMGWTDRKDMPLWAEWIAGQDPEAVIIMHGVSMGGAAVMMTAGEETIDNVVAFIEDCGYTSVWDIFTSELKVRFNLPAFPLLTTASKIAGLRAGWTFTEASAVDQLRKCTKPMLFIHGVEDDFVPYYMLEPLYNADPCEEKQIVSVENAGHAESDEVLGEAYWETVFAFIDQYTAEN